MSYILYAVYNLIFQVVSICFLFFANTYLNGFLIPDTLKWKGGKIREDLTGLAIAQTAILVLEAALLMLILLYINRLFLSNIAKISNVNAVANWTSGIYLLVTLIFIAYLIYVGFK